MRAWPFGLFDETAVRGDPLWKDVLLVGGLVFVIAALGLCGTSRGRDVEATLNQVTYTHPKSSGAGYAVGLLPMRDPVGYVEHKLTEPPEPQNPSQF
jgi:hypothetical protein